MATKAQDDAAARLVDFLHSQKDILDQQIRWLRARPDSVEDEVTQSAIMGVGERLSVITALGTRAEDIVTYISTVKRRG